MPQKTDLEPHPGLPLQPEVLLLPAGHVMKGVDGGGLLRQGVDAFAVRARLAKRHDLVDRMALQPAHNPDGGRFAVNWNRTLPGYDSAVRIFDLSARDSAKLNGLGTWPAGWSPDGRYVYIHGPTQRMIFRIDVMGARPEETTQTLPRRQAECSPAGHRHPRAFICAVFESVSHVWMIEDLD